MIEEQDNDVNELSESEAELTGHISNLAAAFSYIMEVDGELLSQVRKKKLARMKRRIFDALDYYCECLPEIEKNAEDKD